MMEQAYAVILAGGQGERFWPLSTPTRPKQFLALIGDRPLLAQAVDRLEGLVPADRILVVTGRNQVAAAREAVPGIPPENVIGEPCGRDTAAAITLGGALVQRRDPGAVFVVLTADHVIGDPRNFRNLLDDTLRLAAAGEHIITIGIKPRAPSTGFGYIEAGQSLLTSGAGTSYFRARRFVEKPDLDAAREYIAAGRYYWNAGMFVWSLTTLYAALCRHCPPLARLMDRLGRLPCDALEAEIDRAYPALEKISIDYALMEKADNILLAPASFAWDDVGSWPALADHFDPDGEGNVCIGPAVLLDAQDNIVVSHDEEGGSKEAAGQGVVALLGVQGLVVARAGNTVLVCARERAQEVKRLVRQLREKGRTGDQV